MASTKSKRQGRRMFSPGFDIDCCAWSGCERDRLPNLPTCAEHINTCVCNRETGSVCAYHRLMDEYEQGENVLVDLLRSVRGTKH